MAFGRDTTAEHIKPLSGAIVRKFTAHAAIDAGALVSKNSDSGEVAEAVATSVVLAPVGVAVQAAAAAGDKIDVVVFGPVLCQKEATPGGLVYVSDTAGEPSESTGTKTTVMGWSETATILFVRPQVVSFS